MKNLKKLIVILAFLILIVEGCAMNPFKNLPATTPVTAADGPMPSSTSAGATATPEKKALQSTVHTIVAWVWVAGLLCLIAAGLMGYIGQYVPCVKLALAGLCLPILATWFSYHWALVIWTILLSSAALFVCFHYAFLQPLFSKLESLFGSAFTELTAHAQNLESAIKAAQSPVPQNSPLAANLGQPVKS